MKEETIKKAIQLLKRMHLSLAYGGRIERSSKLDGKNKILSQIEEILQEDKE